ncbi:MAG: hypothetical protein ACRDY0_00150 [Acidimicrobiales bacterium]
MRLATRAWQLASPLGAGVSRRRRVLVGAFAGADVGLSLVLRRSKRPLVAPRVVVDAIDALVWNCLADNADQAEVSMVPLGPLALECSVRYRWLGLVEPLACSAVAIVVRALTGRPLRASQAAWPVIMAIPGLSMGFADAADEAAARGQAQVIAAMAADAAEQAVTRLSVDTDSLADLVRDAAHKLELAGGDPTRWALLDDWKRERSSWVTATGLQYLATVLRSWEAQQSHADLGAHVRFVVDRAVGLTLLDPTQAATLLDALDEDALAGPTEVRVDVVGEGPSATVVVRLGPCSVVLAGPASLPRPRADYAVSALAIQAALMAMPALPSHGGASPLACLGPALGAGTAAVWAARSVPVDSALRRRALVGAATAALGAHVWGVARSTSPPGATPPRTAKPPTGACSALPRPAFHPAVAGHVSLLAAYRSSMSGPERHLAWAGLAMVVALGFVASPAPRSARAYLADSVWSVGAYALTRSIAVESARLASTTGLENAAIDDAVGAALDGARSFFSDRVRLLDELVDQAGDRVPEGILAEVAQMLATAGERCAQIPGSRS